MKLRHIAPAVALTIAGASSFAAAPAAQFSFHISGSSALQKVVAKAIANNCSSLATYSGLLGSNAAGYLDNANGQSHTLYACTVSSTSAWGGTYQNKTLNIYMNTQGSAFGVFPVAYNLAINFIDPSSCTLNSGSTTAGTCNNVVTAAPDAGLSDLEPTMFNSLSNHSVAATANAPAGTVFPTLYPQYTSVAASNFFSSQIAAVQTFGLIVSNALLADLQTDQGLTSTQIPTISSSAFATIYAPGYSVGTIGNWQPLFTGALANAGTVNNQVNICSRLPGSGTRALAQAFFLQVPFSSTPQAFATAAGDNYGNGDQTLSQNIGLNNPGTYEIGEYDNSSAVTGCVANAVSGAYAIGLVSTDRASGNVAQGAATNSNYTFVNLDGSVPNASAARYGKYQWVYEAWYQVSKTAADRGFATAFGAAFITPTNINNLGAPSTNGVMAAVANCPTTPYTGAEAAVCSHVTRNGNSASILQYAQ